MELDLDKEIDALLRKNALSAAAAESVPGTHLDADEIAAFAESGIPERTRSAYIRHFAECGRCRTILASAMAGAEEEALGPMRAPDPVPQVPWYRKMFLMPQLAYVMGSLVLVFTGAIGFFVLQRQEMVLNTEVSQAGNRAAYEAEPVSNTSSSTYSSANAAANSAAVYSNGTVNARPSANANAAAAGRPISGDETQSPPAAPAGVQPADKDVSADGIDLAKNLPPPPPPAKEGQTAEKQLQTVPLAEAKRDAIATQRSEEYNNMQVQRAPGAGEQAKTQRNNNNDGPFDMRSNQEGETRAKLSNARKAEAGNRRMLSGKSFDLKQGAWYDSAYRGQGTINVKRGTAEYRNLDAGLRGIAENLSGVVVVVWKEKAYRIQ